MATDIKVPDIGDFTDVPVVTILVSVGDIVAGRLDAGVEQVEGEQADDGDGEAAGGGDEGFADATGDLAGVDRAGGGVGGDLTGQGGLADAVNRGANGGGSAALAGEERGDEAAVGLGDGAGTGVENDGGVGPGGAEQSGFGGGTGEGA